MGEIELNSIRNKKVCHLKDDSKTSTRAVRQRTHLLSELCSTCFVDVNVDVVVDIAFVVAVVDINFYFIAVHATNF